MYLNAQVVTENSAWQILIWARMDTKFRSFTMLQILRSDPVPDVRIRLRAKRSGSERIRIRNTGNSIKNSVKTGKYLSHFVFSKNPRHYLSEIVHFLYFVSGDQGHMMSVSG
jgi:hypothetical protein